jgi:gamma-glutamyltranspeptidase/glutathione hydrolase
MLLLGLDEVAGPARAADPALGSGLNPAWYMRAKRAAFALRDRYAADPERVRVPTDLLSPRSLARIAGGEDVPDAEAKAGAGDTSSLVVVDAAGNAVSWVQSLFEEFGSGVVSARTGVVLHNRLYLEQLDSDPVRGLRPGMRPFHTLCPAIVVGEHGCDLAIATPGDHGQPQSIYQVLCHVYEEGAVIQDAVERPRLRHDQGSEVMVEDRAPPEWSAALRAAGYRVRDVGPWSRLMGGVNAVQRLGEGVWAAGADPRRSSYAMTAEC